MYDAFEQRGVAVIAVSQEESNLQKHGLLPDRIKPKPRFPVVADLNRAVTKRYDRTTAYLIDKSGIVRQVFPMLIHSRPSWEPVLHEIDRLKLASK